jgi:hypothetical protein
MKSRNKILIGEADSDEYMQDCSASTHYQPAKNKEEKLVYETRQLYATEAEDYFFYFISVEENGMTGVAV